MIGGFSSGFVSNPATQFVYSNAVQQAMTAQASSALETLGETFRGIGDSPTFQATVQKMNSTWAKLALVGLVTGIVIYYLYQRHHTKSVNTPKKTTIPSLIETRSSLEVVSIGEANAQMKKDMEEVVKQPSHQLPPLVSPLVQQYRAWFSEAAKKKELSNEERYERNLHYFELKMQNYAALVDRWMDIAQVPEEARTQLRSAAVGSFYDYCMRLMCKGEKREHLFELFCMETEGFKHLCEDVVYPFFASAEHRDNVLLGFRLQQQTQLPVERLKRELERDLGSASAQVMKGLREGSCEESSIVGLKTRLYQLFNSSQRLVLQEALLEVINDETFVRDVICDPVILGSDIHLNQSWLTDARIEFIVKRAKKIYDELGKANETISRLRTMAFNDALPMKEDAALEHLPPELKIILKGQVSAGTAQEKRDKFRLIVNQAYVNYQMETRYKNQQPGSLVQQLVLVQEAGVDPKRYDVACLEVVGPMKEYLETLLIPNKSRGYAPDAIRRAISQQALSLLMTELGISADQQFTVMLRVQGMERLEAQARRDYFSADESLHLNVSSAWLEKFPHLLEKQLVLKRRRREIELRDILSKCIQERRDSLTVDEKSRLQLGDSERGFEAEWGYYRDHFYPQSFVEGVQGYSAAMALGNLSGRCAAISTRVLGSLVLDPEISLTDIRSNEWESVDGFRQARYAVLFDKKEPHPSEKDEEEAWRKVLTAYDKGSGLEETMNLKLRKSAAQTLDAFVDSCVDALKSKTGALRLHLRDSDRAHAVAFYVDEEKKRYIWHNSNSLVVELKSRADLEAVLRDYIALYWPKLAEFRAFAITQKALA